MAQATTKDLTTLPVGRLGLIPLISCKDLGEKVNEWLIQWRKERSHEELDSFAFEGYQRESYLIPVQTARFGSGEAKCTIMESVRGDDIYLMVDVCNYSLTYSIGPYENLMSPDDHFQDLKRVIGAIGGKARRVNVIMPYLYESRQNIRSGRESLDLSLIHIYLVVIHLVNTVAGCDHYIWFMTAFKEFQILINSICCSLIPQTVLFCDRRCKYKETTLFSSEIPPFGRA